MCLPWFHFSHLELRASSCPALSPQGKCDMPFPTQLFREFWHLRPFPPLGKFHFLTHFLGNTALTENLKLDSIFWSSCLIKCVYRKTGPLPGSFPSYYHSREEALCSAQADVLSCQGIPRVLGLRKKEEER